MLVWYILPKRPTGLCGGPCRDDMHQSTRQTLSDMLEPGCGHHRGKSQDKPAAVRQRRSLPGGIYQRLLLRVRSQTHTSERPPRRYVSTTLELTCSTQWHAIINWFSRYVTVLLKFCGGVWSDAWCLTKIRFEAPIREVAQHFWLRMEDIRCPPCNTRRGTGHSPRSNDRARCPTAQRPANKRF